MEDGDNPEDDNPNSLLADGLADTNYPGDMKDLASILLEMKKQTAILHLEMKKQTAVHLEMKKQTAVLHLEMKKQTALLESIHGEMKQSNHNKQDENRPLGSGKEISTVHEEHQVHHLHFNGSYSGQPLPQSVSLPRAEKKYRLHIVGEVYNHPVPEKNGCITRNVIRGTPFKVEVILKDGDQKVEPDDPLAKVRVELVVLDEHWDTEGFINWKREEFEDHFMMVSLKDKNKMVPKGSVSCSGNRVIVDKGVFSLDGGQIDRMVSINQFSERNKKVKLGVMVYAADRGQERVLEGVSSNKFNVIEKLRKSKGKRPLNSENPQPSSSNSQYSGFPNGINNDIQKILSYHLPAARNRLSEQGILNLLQTQLQDLSSMLQQGCPMLDAINTVMETIDNVYKHVVASIRRPDEVVMIQLKYHLEMLYAKLYQFTSGASSSAVTQQENYGAPGSPWNDAPATDSHMMDREQNNGLQGQSHPSSAPGMGGHGAGHPSSTPRMGGHDGGFGGQQYGNMLWRPSYAPTSNSQWTSGLSPTYLGQTNGSNRNFLDQQYSEGYYVDPSEYDIAYAASGEQIENTYGPYGYGNEGVLARSRPAHMRSPPQQKLVLHKVIRSIPSGYSINDRRYMWMVAMIHQQAMNSEGVMRKCWKKMYRRALRMMIYERRRRLYGKNKIWYLIDQQYTMHELVHDLASSITISELEPPKQREVKSQADSLGNKSFVVVDLKATCWDTDENKDRRLRQEIVEFSSVLVDAATGHTKSTFHEYVIPSENHLLSEYCKNFNGIKQEDVDSNYAMSLDKALEKHQAWIGRLTNGNRAAAVVVTWGNWDCRTMLKQECFRKKLDIPDYFHRWINLKKPFEEKYGKGYWNKSVEEAFEVTELKWEGAIKGGESHAHNKARLLSSLIHQGANLAITGWLDPAAAAPNN